MLFLVTTDVRDSLVGDAVPRVREEVGQAIQRIQASGAMQAGGVLVGKRGFCALLEVETAKAIFDLLGGEILDNMKVELSPIVSFEDLAELFTREAANR